MRDSSVSAVRIHSARGGASMSHELLGRVDERHLVRERRQPVDAVDQRRDLRVRAELGELLVAAVHVADDRIGRDDALAVEPHDEAQRAVRGRVLRPDVEHHVAGVELDVHLRVGEVAVQRRVDVELGQLAGLREVGARRHDASTAGPVSSSPRGSRPASARRRRGPATASPRARATGSPCAADGPRTPTAGRGDAGSGGRRTRRRTSPRSPARASRRPDTPAPTTRACGFVSSTSTLSVNPELAAVRRLDVREHLHAAGRARDAEGHLLRLHRRGRVARAFLGDRRRRHPVDGRDEREVVAAELLLADLGGAAPRVGLHAHDESAERAAVLDDRVAQLGLEARRGGLARSE